MVGWLVGWCMARARETSGLEKLTFLLLLRLLFIPPAAEVVVVVVAVSGKKNAERCALSDDEIIFAKVCSITRFLYSLGSLCNSLFSNCNDSG